MRQQDAGGLMAHGLLCHCAAGLQLEKAQLHEILLSSEHLGDQRLRGNTESEQQHQGLVQTSFVA